MRDAYAAMVTDRPYRLALPVAELRRCAGTQFHPAVTAALCALAQAREGPALRTRDRAASVPGRGRLGREMLTSDREARGA